MWNWQKSDWPHFTWDASPLAEPERRFLLQTGVLAGALKHLNSPERRKIAIDAMSTDAVATSEIEGEILDRHSIQSSIANQLGLPPDKRRIKPAERGVAEAMVDLYRTATEPLTHERLFSWHRMLVQGRRDLTDVGRYRTDTEPMQVISGPIASRQVHFEAPPSSQVTREMNAFIAWFNNTAPDGPSPLSPLTRAGIAHLYFVSIHPFEDGNGRIGRILSEKALVHQEAQPVLVLLASAILSKRKAYYTALAAANTDNEITPWLCWFAEIALEAQRQTIARVDFAIQTARLLARLHGNMNARQEKAILRMVREGADGFKGGLSAANYSVITGASSATTTRDLADLVVKGALKRVGELRHARYHLAPAPDQLLESVHRENRVTDD